MMKDNVIAVNVMVLLKVIRESFGWAAGVKSAYWPLLGISMLGGETVRKRLLEVTNSIPVSFLSTGTLGVFTSTSY